MRLFFYLLFAVLFIFSLTSCKSISSKNYVGNGIEDNDNHYPAVLEIFSDTGEGFDPENHCTSSVISHNTLLTASHCLADIDQPSEGENCTIKSSKKVKVILPSGKEVFSKNYYLNTKFMNTYIKTVCQDMYPNMTDQEFQTVHNTNLRSDIAIVVFDDNTFSDISPLKISNKKVQVGDKVQLVGYAYPIILVDKSIYDGEVKVKDEVAYNQIYDKKYEHVKRYGFTTVKENLFCGYELFEIGSPIENRAVNSPNKKDPPGVNATIELGDSGSPVLSYKNQNLILGLPSEKVRVNKEDHTCILTFEKENIDWLKKINKETDAIIPLDEIK